VSFISCFLRFCWFFLYNQPFFSSLEATRSTYFECIALPSLCGCVTSRGRLPYLVMCLALLRKLLRLRLILASCNFMVPFKIFDKVTHRLVYTCSKPNRYLIVVVGQPMSLEDFNLYVFRGLCGKFKDLVTSRITKAEPLSYADLHNNLLTHEFLHKNSLHSMDVNPFLLSSSLLPQQPLLPTPQPSVHLVMSLHSSNFSRNKGRSRGNWHPNINRYNHQNRGQSAADWRPNNW